MIVLRKLILIIDFNNVLFTSYYGQKLINQHGYNVNAVKGFFTKLKNLKDIFDPDFIVFARDLSRVKTFRRKLFPDYKAQRKPMDPDIFSQMKMAQQIVALLGFSIISHELYEADDIMGMISRFGEEHEMDSIIISSDRDMYQLITDHTFVMSPRNSDLIDKNYLQEHYQLTPDQWIELKILQGDRSDNIPGIPGIGEVTALQLMQQYGSIQNIYQSMDRLKPKIQSLLTQYQDTLDLTRKLVTIETDYTLIDLKEEMLYRHDVFTNEVWDILADQQLYSLFDIMQYSLFPSQNDKVEVHAS